MSKRTLVLASIFVAALGLTVGAVSVVADEDPEGEPEFTVWSEPGDLDVTFGTTDDNQIERTVTVQIENTGDEAGSPDVDVTDTPSGVSVDSGSEPNLDPGERGSVDLDVSIEYDADDGTVEGGVAGDDDFEFDVDVDGPPLAGFDDEPFDLGDILVGESESGDVTVEEVGGDQGLNGVEWTIVSDDSDATLSLNDMDGSGFGEGSVTTGAGGDDEAEWEVDVNNEVDQHEDLEWTIELHADGYDYATREVDVEARVIYPAEFGGMDHDGTITFDEPRDETRTITETIDLEVSNVGDLELDVSNVRASSDESGIDVTVLNHPDEIDGTSTETATLEVEASTGLSEGEYDLSATAVADDFSIDDESYSGELEIEHELQLGAETGLLTLGDIPIGNPEPASVALGEELGYRNVEDLSVELEDGPDDWLTLKASPSSLNAGGEEDLEFDLEFTTDAEQGSDYEWTYVVSGSDVDDKTVTVSATPVPLDLGPISAEVSSLDDEGAEQASVSEAVVAVIDEMDEQMRAGEAADADISRTLAFGDATILYLESLGDTIDAIEDGEHDAAQIDMQRAAASYSAMSIFADDLENPALHSASEDALVDGEAALEAVIDDQEAHYEARLEDGEGDLREEAIINRELARIASLQGNEERAQELNSEADDAFDAYTEAVAQGEAQRQHGNERWEQLNDDQFVSVAGRPLLVNPAHYDEFSERSADLHDAYENATANFEAAGETDRSEAVAAEYDERASAIELARLSLYASIGIYGLFVLGIVVWTARGMFWYVQDARESVNGDFLV